MYLKRVLNKKTGRVFLEIAQSYRDSNGKPKIRIHEKLGYLDELEKEMDDPVAYYKEYAKKAGQRKVCRIEIPLTEQIDRSSAHSKNYGYLALSKIYHELELDKFFNNKRRHKKFKYNSESIMRLLAYSRVLYPQSKKGTLENKEKYFEGFDFSLDDVYDSLTHFGEYAEAVQCHLHEKVTEQYDRKANLIYYDVTNYYFETDIQDEERKKGYSKENRRAPIIQMGLALDEKNIPMAYKIFPGNTTDSETYIPALKCIKKQFGVKRAIVVADKGLNCGDNIVFSAALGDGYIFSQSVRGGSKDLKAYVLSAAGYSKPTDEGFKVKSRVCPAKVKITAGTTKSGNKSKKTITLEEQKQVVFYSPKYAERASKKREAVLEKAKELISDPTKYSRATSYGAIGYVQNLEFDEDTGEILKTNKKLVLDYSKIEDEAKYDGFYAIITSETTMSDDQIIKTYRGLWQIEDTFKLTKSTLCTRPVYVYLREHIAGHFLVCFIALVLLRLLELRLGNQFSAERIVEAMRETTCTRLGDNHYLFHYANDVTDALNAALQTDFGKRVMSLNDIRKSLSDTKKHLSGRQLDDLPFRKM
jgi:transposase